MTTNHPFIVGKRVVTRRPQDFFPDFIVPTNSKGTITHIEIADYSHVGMGKVVAGVSVLFDDKIEGCEEWDNKVYWTWNHFIEVENESEFLRELSKELDVIS